MRALMFAVCSIAALPALAHSGVETTLPLGDGKTSATPRRGHVYACSTAFPGGQGAFRAGEWIAIDHWFPARKPVVEGNIAWPDSAISVTREGSERVVRANGLPSHGTGEFPIRPGSAAYAYDRNPNRITQSETLLRLPASPAPLQTPGCVPMGMIGFTLTGVAIYNAFDAQGRDAPAYEIQDKCSGHPDRIGRYHYHDWSACIIDHSGSAGGHSDLAGYMLDGFPIHGLKGIGGKTLRNDDLDECHGHQHDIEVDGQHAAMYHYHYTHQYPYTIGCFKGAVDPALMRLKPPPGKGFGPPPPKGY